LACRIIGIAVIAVALLVACAGFVAGKFGFSGVYVHGPKTGYDKIQESDEIRVAAAGPAVVAEYMNSRADSSA
jgi:hypothetical protein